MVTASLNPKAVRILLAAPSARPESPPRARSRLQHEARIGPPSGALRPVTAPVLRAALMRQIAPLVAAAVVMATVVAVPMAVASVAVAEEHVSQVIIAA
jgi:hypothetical protein